VVTSLYRPPSCSDTNFFNILDLHLDNLEKIKLPVFLCCDSNYNLLKINSEATSMQLVEAFSAHAYSSLTMKATRFNDESRCCIDQIWTNKADKASLASIYLTTYSEHFTTAALINLSGSKVQPKLNNSYRKCSETNISKFNLAYLKPTGMMYLPHLTLTLHVINLFQHSTQTLRIAFLLILESILIPCQ